MASLRVALFGILTVVAAALPHGVMAAQTQCATGDYKSLEVALRSWGAVELTGSVNHPFFSVPGKRIRINGDSIQVFEYASPALAEEAASSVSPDGYVIDATRVEWVLTPHYYRCRRLIVLYVGDSESLLPELTTLLGPQFAGGTSIPEI